VRQVQIVRGARFSYTFENFAVCEHKNVFMCKEGDYVLSAMQVAHEED
jgi:hypothetical protein